jgi:hypothetical protein
MLQIQRTSACLCYVNSVPCQIYHNCRFGDSAGNIQLDVPPFPLEICREFGAGHAPHLLPDTAHVLLFTLCQLWSGSNPMLLQVCIFMFQLSIPLLLVICLQYDACYTPNILLKTAYFSWFTLCQL